MVVVAHHPMEIQPCLQMLCPGGTRRPSRDHKHHLEVKEATTSNSVNDVAGTMAVMVRRELAQHGARSVAFARDVTTTRQSVGRLPRCQEEVDPSRSKGTP